ncbi:hypothetical protein CsatA_027849 [Cannabis sativa]
MLSQTQEVLVVVPKSGHGQGVQSKLENREQGFTSFGGVPCCSFAGMTEFITITWLMLAD